MPSNQQDSKNSNTPTPPTTTAPGSIATPAPTATPTSPTEDEYSSWNGKTDTSSIRTNPLKFEGEPTFGGIHRVTDEALQNPYNLTAHNDFGSTNVTLHHGDTINVKDMMYDLGSGKVGMHIIPVNDSGNVSGGEGESLPGYQLMDNYLRKQMGLNSDDSIYTLISYIHPELNTGDLSALAEEMLKTEMGNTHLGAYIGRGATSNSPEDYHYKKWAVNGYPANVQVLSLQDVPQAVLNKNARLVDDVLNNGVVFPEDDYKNDKFRTIDLNTSLFFYKEWLLQSPENNNVLRSEKSWYTYCAEHKTIVVNVMLNVPHNEASFKEIFTDDGEALWQAFKKDFASKNGRTFEANDETHFEPLWKKIGLSATELPTIVNCIRAWKNIGEYNDYDKARHAGALDSYSGFKPLSPGRGMAWAPETTADLLKSFANAYTSLRNVGGVMCVATVAQFMKTVKNRMGISPEDYIKLSLPIMSKIMLADAKMNAKNEANWFQTKSGSLSFVFGAQVKALIQARDDAQGENSLEAPDPDTDKMVLELEKLADGIMSPVNAELAQIVSEEPLNVDQAELWLDDAIEVDLIAARKKAVNDPTKVQFNSPPAVTHRVAIGLHKASRYITIKTVATAMFSEEIKTQVGEVGYSEHTVVSGDNLYALSRQYYENSSGWDRIFQANRDILDNANDLSIGQVLRIPTG